MKARIIERTAPNGKKTWVIQQRHFLFRWLWVDAWVNSPAGAACNYSFHTPDEAEKNLCFFDGTPTTSRVYKTADSPND